MLADHEIRSVFPAELEIRQGGRTLGGTFAYGAIATVSNRGRRRKEVFAPRAFRFAIEDEAREINLLSGHEFGKPIASRKAGSLTIRDSDQGVSFEAILPDTLDQPSWMRDAILSIQAGLTGGVSPGFSVAPIPDAESEVPEPGNPSVSIRVIREALLFEMSLVTRPAYPETSIDLRRFDSPRDDGPRPPDFKFWW